MYNVMMDGVKLKLIMGALAAVAMAVKIDNLKVPSQHILDKYKNPEPLILDCEYDLPVHENGFVLKWYLNDQLIYQWISTAQPRFYVHNLMRSSIDLSYATMGNKNRTRHRALTITKPTINMTGIYTCAVGTFQSEEKRSSHMQIIVPESDFVLKITEENDGYDGINVECSVHEIYPEPKLMISIGEDNRTLTGFVTQTRRDETRGLWDVILSGKLKRQDCHPTDVHCTLIIPNTTYIKQKEVSRFTNRGPKLSAPTKTTIIVILMLSTLLINNG